MARHARPAAAKLHADPELVEKCRELDHERKATAASNRRVQRILMFGLAPAPLLAGIDKVFFHIINWDQYLSPVALHVLGHHSHLFMTMAGVLEILVGIGMFIWPQVCGYIISGWLMSIVLNLLATGTFFDVALRDFGLSLGTFALARLSAKK